MLLESKNVYCGKRCIAKKKGTGLTKKVIRKLEKLSTEIEGSLIATVSLEKWNVIINIENYGGYIIIRKGSD